MSDEIGAVDLLGEPFRELRDGRGRPKHRVSEENRNKVSVLRAAGWLQKEIAEAIGVSEPTLREYYFSELDGGAIRARAEALWKLKQLALKEGNVSALKALLARFDAGNTLPKAVRFAQEEPAAPKGKKEQLRDAAESGHRSTAWGSLLPN